MTNNDVLEVIICGVGGQGVVLMSELLGHSAVSDGIGVKGSEVLGMAQRGGSVYSNIRLGSGAQASMTLEGKCDVLVAVEPSEALRHLNFLSKNSLVIINSREVLPFTVFLGRSGYPEMDEIIARVKKVTDQVVVLDAAQLALDAGSQQSTNVVMLGALFGSGRLPIREETAKEAIKERFNAKVAEINIKAFDTGYNVVKDSLKAITAK